MISITSHELPIIFYYIKIITFQFQRLKEKIFVIFK